MQDEFAKRDTKLIGLAVARLHSHKKWIWHIHSNVVTSNRIKFPIVADEKADIAKMYDM
jgi:alkyl hydroperoxide reductase subunit AhpC